MTVPPIQMAALNWAAAAAGTLAEPWKVDSVVSGRVLEYLSETLLMLEIEGIKVEAVVPSPNRIPRQFLARVRGNGESPALELVGTTPDRQRVTAALRERLPQQDGLPPLLADLHALARLPGTRQLPPRVREALARLEASIADHRDVLDPDVLRDTVRRAGVQLEHATAQLAREPGPATTTVVDYDLKGALQRLVQVLTETTPTAQAASARPATGDSGAAPPLLQLPLQPQSRAPASPDADAAALAGNMPGHAPAAAATALVGNMLGHAQAALSRIEIMQLQAHPWGSPHACMVEIPVRGEEGFDVLQIRIDDDAGAPVEAGSEPAANWTLEFTLDLPGLGPVQGQIRLRGIKVGIDLWVQHDTAVQALDEQNSVLSRLLQTLGLELVQLRTRRGAPARRTDLGRTLLDTSA